MYTVKADINRLGIGNYLRHVDQKDDEYLKVTGITETIITTDKGDYHVDKLVPINVNPKWLLDFGFRQVKWQDVGKYWDCKKEDNYQFFVIDLEDKNNKPEDGQVLLTIRVRKHGPDNYEFENFIEMPELESREDMIFNPYFVHEIQNQYLIITCHRDNGIPCLTL